MTTLADLLFDNHGAAVRSVRDGLADRRRLGWRPLAGLPDEQLDHVAQAIAGLLATPLTDLLLVAWDATAAIQQAQRTTQGRPDAVESITLVNQRFPLTRRVQLWVEAHGPEIWICDVVLTGELHLGFVTLTVRNGRTTHVAPVEVSAGIHLGVAKPGDREVHRLATCQSPTVTIGGPGRGLIDQRV